MNMTTHSSRFPAFFNEYPTANPPDPPSIVTRNIVATVNLGIRLDLKTIAMHARNAEYNPKVRRSFLC